MINFHQTITINMSYCLLISSWFYKWKSIKRHDRWQLTIHMCVMEQLIKGFSNWLIYMDHWNPLVHRLIAQRSLKSSLNFCSEMFQSNHHNGAPCCIFSTSHAVTRGLNSHQISSLLSQTLWPLGVSSWKKGFLPSKNPFLPIEKEEIPFFREETQPW